MHLAAGHLLAMAVGLRWRISSSCARSFQPLIGKSSATRWFAKRSHWRAITPRERWIESAIGPTRAVYRQQLTEGVRERVQAIINWAGAFHDGTEYADVPSPRAAEVLVLHGGTATSPMSGAGQALRAC